MIGIELQAEPWGPSPWKELSIEEQAKTMNTEITITEHEPLEKEVKELIEKKKGLSIGAYMGILMGKYRGKVEGKKIMELLRKFIK
mgnify:CR=1 FL=1